MTLTLPPGERVRFAPSRKGAQIIRAADGVEAGEVRYGSGAPGELIIEALVIAPAYRGYGLGSEAARLVVDDARESGVHTVRALAPGQIGLSVYFWTRMGFRPRHGEAPKEGIWFERRL